MANLIDTATFKEKIFDYEHSTEWKYKGDLPALIDFYAEWCGPCKMVAPILERMAKKYEGRLHIYKVDTEAEPELAGVFGIQSVPTLFFVPMSGDPKFALGALPEKELEKVIDEFLLA